MTVNSPARCNSTESVAHRFRARVSNHAGGSGIAFDGCASDAFSFRFPGLPLSSLSVVGFDFRPRFMSWSLFAQQFAEKRAR
ncbi:MAG TPA: hypothetical protein VM487_15580, partial [Phycisphaerae bacterium]|nr:hypothetical protein [Phycisphaerae bacterium]